MRNFWCEINLTDIEYNINYIRSKTNKKIMAVVKANAYGLGIEEITCFLNNIVDAFAVATVDEALKVKSDKDILILNPVFTDDDLDKTQNNFIFTVDNMDSIEKLGARDEKYRVHIYVDTGMNRFGINPEKLEEFIKKIDENYKNIEIEGIYSHLHNTENYQYTKRQIEIFKQTAIRYRERVKFIHLLNSAGFTRYNDLIDIDNMLRIGNIIYGYSGYGDAFKKSFNFFAKPLRVYHVDKNEYIGYGNRFRTKKKMKIGILDVGNIDGFGFSKKIKRNIFYEFAKIIYNRTRNSSEIFYRDKNVKIIAQPSMCHTIINMEGIGDDCTFKINLSPILADSSIPKKYRKGDSYVYVQDNR
ncbi:alanine racemase [Fonticella tunisiensis]|uniref:Alanine racemase n=1 Tax=Fonticella tunisiensis TaxID=1096341 RepID=A0A4R7KX83_9CLOT|nr:alanine racemase [Fonticella tunisiensis]TDT63620.1 alanine racemase [Fonticella tunisiensis]